MTVVLPEVRTGEPMPCGGLMVFPLFTSGNNTLDFILAADALARGTVAIREVSEKGCVAEILLENGGDAPVLFLEGEEIVGAKQNRFVATSVLVDARTTVVMPVLCAEWSRWRHASPSCAIGSFCPPSLRQFLKERTRRGRIAARYGPEQVAIWKEIERRHQALGIPFQSGRLSQVLETHRSRVEALRANIRCVEGASGIAVANNGLAVSVDIFGDPSICQQVWLRFLDGVALDALESPEVEAVTIAPNISGQLYRLRHLAWRQVQQAIGLGEHLLARGDDGTLAAALVVDGSLVHASISFPIT